MVFEPKRESDRRAFKTSRTAEAEAEDEAATGPLISFREMYSLAPPSPALHSLRLLHYATDDIK